MMFLFFSNKKSSYEKLINGTSEETTVTTKILREAMLNFIELQNQIILDKSKLEKSNFPKSKKNLKKLKSYLDSINSKLNKINGNILKEDPNKFFTSLTNIYELLIQNFSNHEFVKNFEWLVYQFCQDNQNVAEISYLEKTFCLIKSCAMSGI